MTMNGSKMYNWNICPESEPKISRVKYEQYERTLQNYITLYQDYTSIHISSQNHIILYQDYIIQYKYIYFRSCQDFITLYNYTLEGPLRTISHFTPWLHHAIQLYIFKFLSEQSYFYSGLSYSIDTVCVYTQMYECTIRNIITAMWYQWLYVSPHQCSTIVRIIITKIDYCTNKDYRRTSQWRFMCFVGGAPPFRPLTAFLSFHSCYWYYLPSSSRWWHKSWHEL